MHSTITFINSFLVLEATKRQIKTVSEKGLYFITF